MSLRPVNGAPPSAEPMPERVKSAQGRRPLKRTPEAVKEREKKRTQRAGAKLQEHAQEQLEAAGGVPPELVVEMTPADAAALLQALMMGLAVVLQRPVLRLEEQEAKKCGGALAPVLNKYAAASVIGKYALELHALTTCADVLAPKIQQALQKPEPERGGLPPVPDDAARAA